MVSPIRTVFGLVATIVAVTSAPTHVMGQSASAQASSSSSSGSMAFSGVSSNAVATANSNIRGGGNAGAGAAAALLAALLRSCVRKSAPDKLPSPSLSNEDLLTAEVIRYTHEETPEQRQNDVKHSGTMDQLRATSSKPKLRLQAFRHVEK